MEKIKYILKQWWFYLILFALTLVIPIIINELYKPSVGYVTLWSAEDVLAFYGSYLSFIGTIVLGIAAIYQNKKAHLLNEQMQKLQQAQFISMISISNLEISKRSSTHPQYVNMNMRTLEFIDLTAENFECTHCYHVDILFENSSQYPIVQIVAHGGSRQNINCLFWGMVKHKESAIYIPEHGTQAIRFIIPSTVFEAQQCYQLALSIDFINIFGYKTVATVNLPNLKNETQRNEYIYRLAMFTDLRS